MSTLAELVSLYLNPGFATALSVRGVSEKLPDPLLKISRRKSIVNGASRKQAMNWRLETELERMHCHPPGKAGNCAPGGVSAKHPSSRVGKGFPCLSPSSARKCCMPGVAFRVQMRLPSPSGRRSSRLSRETN